MTSYFGDHYDNIQAEIAREDSFRKRKQVIHALLHPHDDMSVSIEPFPIHRPVPRIPAIAGHLPRSNNTR
jgi:hypothetical protein